MNRRMGARRVATTAFLVALVAGCDAAPDGGAAPAADSAADTSAAASDTPDSLSVADVGLQTPESVLHDADRDLYLVSNINGAPLEKDDNGFISLISPDGRLLNLKWIDGAAEGVRLSAPKGMALVGDKLYVADIDSIRVFDRNSGDPLDSYGIPGATFLNDLAAGPDGMLYVTDTGMRAGASGLEPSGTAAVYRLDHSGRPSEIARGNSLQAPNGIAVHEDEVMVATFGGDIVYRLDPAGQRTVVVTLPSGQLDGLERTSDGSLLVSSWEAGAVYRVDPQGEAQPLVENVEAPADIGYDRPRARVLIPLFKANRIEIRSVGNP